MGFHAHGHALALFEFRVERAHAFFFGAIYSIDKEYNSNNNNNNQIIMEAK